MCGIAGLLDPSGKFPDAKHLVSAMSTAIKHRGPDDDGSWTDPDAGIAFGHRRLSIIDLSAAGHQPMVSASGRTVVTFNGEIYNHRDLRRELQKAGHQFRGHSDTEVLVEAIDRWGVRRTLERANAMLALAVWERDRRVLTLARDRLGEKPLYYGDANGALVFASELKALRLAPGFDASIDERAVSAMIRWSFIPHPLTINRGAAQLPPGTLLEARVVNGAIVSDEVRWWSIGDVAARGQAARAREVAADAEQRLVELLRDSVRLRLESDVPMGAFLSGGIDSSIIVALAQEALTERSERLRTFTVRMPDVGFDESGPAAAVAKHLGTDHTTVELSEREALDAIPSLPEIYDEPFGDPSMLPTALLCRVTRQHLTVSLGGDGGDELFAGYNRHALGHAIWNRVGRVPRPIRRFAARSLLVPSPSLVDATAQRFRRVLPRRLDLRNPGDKVQKMAAMLSASGSDLWSTLASTWPDPDSVLLRKAERFNPALFGDVLVDPVEEMLLLDTELVLPDEMLVKVDRASMASALEVRVPFLDHRLVEWAWTLPMSAKVNGGQGKRIVRDALRAYLPDDLVDRPKMGFDPPLAVWLRGPLRPWAEELLSEDRLRRDGWFDPKPIRRVWDEHQSGARNWDYRLWAVIMFNAWLDSQ